MKKFLSVLGISAAVLLSAGSSWSFEMPEVPAFSIPDISFCHPAEGKFLVGYEGGSDGIGIGAILGVKSFDFAMTCGAENPNSIKIALPAEIFAATDAELYLFGSDHGIGKTVDYYNVKAIKITAGEGFERNEEVNISRLKLTVTQSTRESVALHVEMPALASYGQNLEIKIKNRPIVVAYHPLPAEARLTPLLPADAVPTLGEEAPAVPSVPAPEEAPTVPAIEDEVPEVPGVVAAAPQAKVDSADPVARADGENFANIPNALVGGACSLSGVTGYSLGDAAYLLLTLMTTLPLLGRRKK